MKFPTLARGDPPRPLRVLVADDSPDTADSLAELLIIAGCETACAYDGQAAFSKVGRFDPDACILDLRMPGLDGWEVARRLRSAPCGELYLLVAVTGLQGREAVRRSVAAGFDRHFLKPADPIELLSYLATGVPRGILQLCPNPCSRLARARSQQSPDSPSRSCPQATVV